MLIFGDCEGEKSPDASVVDDRAVRLLVIEPFDLREAPSNESSFMSADISILVVFVSENPARIHKLLANW